MLELFRAMMKEEWRVHSTMFGSLSFALYPVLICAIAFMGSFLLPYLEPILPFGDFALVIHALFLLLGLMVGAFGLLMNEVMERRFGQSSSLAYSARIFPLSERFIFLNFVVKDTVYYILLWVLPFVLGFALAAPSVGVSFETVLLLLLTLSLSFLTGLSAAFFFSMVYTRSKRLLALVCVLVLGMGAAASVTAGAGPEVLFLPLTLFHAFSWWTLLAACAEVLILSAVAIALLTPESAATTKHYHNRLAPLTDRLSLFPYPALAAKDIIDLSRSGSAVGQTIFSFLVPLGLIWCFLSVLGGFLPQHSILLLFAIITGVVASTMYVWLTMFDSFGPYACLPVSVTMVIKSKICSFAVLQVIPVAFIALLTLAVGAVAYLLPALILCSSVSCYGLAVTIFLTGLSPNVLLYDTRVLASYLLALGLPVFLLIVLSFMNPWYVAAAVLLLPPARWLVQQGYVKWEGREQMTF
ncbi:hypothetical protein RJ40_00135 [Methanofollis aquaemaris]|uniref:Uncharacterized protein n=1 Tax=Methanofollis aquaemaris TaxID=126734 RepID=A0A8A3S215_9EURY|nr:hypothetical protein [Methanofollis aquaemaris]QSZ66019.1 hypothetical protein RJ40_00135 [Methanofollis aquaemaris]